MEQSKAIVTGVSVSEPHYSSNQTMAMMGPLVQIVHDQNTRRRGRPRRPIADESSTRALPSIMPPPSSSNPSMPPPSSSNPSMPPPSSSNPSMPPPSSSSIPSMAPPSSSAPPATGRSYVEGKRPVLARPINSEKKQRNKVGAEKLGDWRGCSTGSSFTPHLITVNPGEDINLKLMEYSLQGPRTVCVISGNGTISSVTLRFPDSEGGTLKYEGLFEIMCFSGSFSPVGQQDKFARSGVMSISLSAKDGRVLGGPIGGPTIAASPVEVFVVSFLMESTDMEKGKRPKTETRVGARVEGSGPGGPLTDNPFNWGPPNIGERRPNAGIKINDNLQGPSN